MTLTRLHTDGILYTALELSNELSAHTLPPLPSPSPPTLLKVLSTLTSPPPPPALASMKVAEILLSAASPEYPTRYLYVSNREDPSDAGDSIAIFSLYSPKDEGKEGKEGGMQMVAEIRTGLHHVRGMRFGGPADRWLVAGGVNCGRVKVFERVEGGRGLREVARCAVEAPTAFLWR